MYEIILPCHHAPKDLKRCPRWHEAQAVKTEEVQRAGGRAQGGTVVKVWGHLGVGRVSKDKTWEKSMGGQMKNCTISGFREEIKGKSVCDGLKNDPHRVIYLNA